MDIPSYQQAVLTWISNNSTHLAITGVVLVLYYFVDLISSVRLREGADQGKFKSGSAEHAIRIIRVLSAIVGALILILAWGFDLGAIFVFASTTLTLLGAALFASWSLLSNVTAYLVLFLHPAFKRGTFVRILDADNFAEGYISELSMFNTKLVTESREVIVYPNILLLGRPVVINPRDRMGGVGKIVAAETVQKNPELQSSGKKS